MQNGLIGLGSGAASALLFASLTSGSYLSIALFYLAPLPLMIAALLIFCDQLMQHEFGVHRCIFIPA